MSAKTTFSRMMDDLKHEWNIHDFSSFRDVKMHVLSCILLAVGLIDGTPMRYRQLNKYISNHVIIKIGRDNYITHKKLEHSEWTKNIATRHEISVRNSSSDDKLQIGCHFCLQMCENKKKDCDIVIRFVKFLRKENIKNYFHNLQKFWNKLTPGTVFINCEKYPTILQGFNPIKPLITHTLFGMSVPEELGEPNNFKSVLFKTLSRWKIVSTPAHGKRTFFQIFDGHGDLVFYPSALDDKEAGFSLSWGSKPTIMKNTTKSEEFIRTAMYTNKGFYAINGSHGMMQNEIVADGPVSLNHLAGVSHRVYKSLLSNRKKPNAQKLLSLINKKLIVVLDKY